MRAKKWILIKRFEGKPTKEDLSLVVYDLRHDLEENEILLESVYLSVDPYMRQHINRYKPPIIMFGEQISKVIKTKNSQFPIGTTVLSNAGWVSHFISKGDDLRPISFDISGTNISQCLGALGMPGAAAYFGFKLLAANPREILILNSAAGTVGSIVGQLAKIKNCTVIGFVGSDVKVDWCKNELGFDHVFNYKKMDFSEAISKVAPTGAHLFFDNVGGEYYHTIINKHMKKYGRIITCGYLSEYNKEESSLYPPTNKSIAKKELKVQGFKVTSFKNDWTTAFVELHSYIKSGRIKTRETIYNGIDLMDDAFIGLFNGQNVGKAIIKNKMNILYL